MAADWGMIQVAVALGFLWLVVPEHWVKVFRPTVRGLWAKVRPLDGQCGYIKWEQLLATSDWCLHQCDGPWLPHSQHEPGEKCWSSSFLRFCNRAAVGTVMKPSQLPMRGNYLCVDREVLLAFILCALNSNYKPPNILQLAGPPPKKFAQDNIQIEIKSKPDDNSGPLVVHVTYKVLESDSSLHNHNLTIGDLRHLINHYPPFYREKLYYDGKPLAPSIMIPDKDSLRRGGWIIAVGLLNLSPVPVYMDVAGNLIDRRGVVFW